MGDGGGGHWLVRMEWRPAGWSVCLPLLIYPCTIKSRRSLLAPAHPGGPGKRAVKRLWFLFSRSRDMTAGVGIEKGSCDPDYFEGWFVSQKLGLDVVYLCAKFDDSSFSQSTDIIGGRKNLK